MSTTLATFASPLDTTRPRFFGLVSGELFKITRQLSTWLFLILLGGVILAPYVIVLITPAIIDQTALLHSYYRILDTGLSVLRVFSGFFLMLLVTRVIGLEYQLGTIRILLARGTGRLQLLFAKLCAIIIVALIVFSAGVLLVSLMTFIVANAYHDVGALQTFPSQFWLDGWTYLLTILINMGATILLATAATVIGRSLAFGMGVALLFFPLDNIGTLIMELVFRATNNNFWLNVTAYLLGPNLNALPNVMTDGRVSALGSTPLALTDPQTHVIHGTQIDATHALIVISVYAVIFAVIALWLTRQRDVKE